MGAKPLALLVVSALTTVTACLPPAAKPAEGQFLRLRTAEVGFRGIDGTSEGATIAHCNGWLDQRCITHYWPS